MPGTSAVELQDLALETEIGTYAPPDTRPRQHMLDLTLHISAALVLIGEDGMDHVFDYDPVVADIARVARDGPYATQERLITRIAESCARYPEIEGAEIRLRKSPVLKDSGALGIRLALDGDDLGRIRATPAPI
ncbi:dihydroneopterin aldolase [Roseovarius sp. SYSU LYC5161]|uniref:dihydroneopterin aldolase n=1 Tax=Roseovarius halophilus (ex Wu et al. 2025) TaxID=3376060 RepID=UPI00399B3D48